MKKVTLVLAAIAILAFSGFASATSTYLVGFQFVATKAFTTNANETGHVIPVNILFNTPTKCNNAKAVLESLPTAYLRGTNADVFGHPTSGPRMFSSLECIIK